MRICLILLLLLSCEKKANREIIHSDNAPKAIGPYSQAIKSGNSLYLAGQIGINPKKGILVEGIENQTNQVISNIKNIIDEAGFSMNDIVQCQIFLKDLNDYKTVNEIYAKTFISKPARAVVEVSRIPLDALIEIMVVAKK